MTVDTERFGVMRTIAAHRVVAKAGCGIPRHRSAGRWAARGND